MGLVLNKTSGKASGLTAQEVDAVHEILTWGRQPDNNKFHPKGAAACVQRMIAQRDDCPTAIDVMIDLAESDLRALKLGV